jgi:2'-5' RNA ligase
MGSNLVIVAIPDENDRVWKISSEKVPHLTLLFLGDSDKVSNLQSIMQFVEHAASTSLKRFYLPVDRRGKLGDDQADVLFFKKDRYDFKAVRDFRSLLLKDSNVKTAYDSATQFETPEAVGAPGQPWIPHLTLGYPASPAKSDDQDFGFFDVRFNRIAVWTGDYEGPEFLLKDYWEEFDEMAIPMDVAMSDLQHYGVKGMRWGHRKTPAQEGGRREGIQRYLDPQGHDLTTDAVKLGVGVLVPVVAPLTIPAQVRLIRGGVRGAGAKLTDREEKKFKKKAQTAENFVKIHNGSGERFNREIGDINKKYPDDLTKDPAKKKQYDGEVQKLMQDAYRQSANSIGNKRQTMHLDVKFKNDGYDFTIHAKEGAPTPLPKRVKHAAEDEDETVTFSGKILRDATGHIVGLKFDDFEVDEMAQTADLGAEFLEHYGVKGMRWGHRKTQLGAGARAVGRGIGKVATFAGDVDFENQVETGRAREMVITKANPAFRRTDLPAVKARHGDYGKLRNRAKKPFAPEAKAYRKDARETYIKRLETTANSLKNVSGDRQYTIRERGWELPEAGGALPKSKHYWDVSSRKVKHAAADDFTRLEVVVDDEGYITDLKKVEIEESMAQTADLGSEFLAHLSEELWSNFTKADYTPEQWHAACLIHTHEGEPTSKNECKLPVKTPDGALNRNGVHAAAAALAGARGGLKGVSDDQKKKAGNALKRYYAQLDEEPPESLAQSIADVGAAFVLEHYGVKGMRWGHRKAPPQAVSPSATSVVPRGTRRKTKIKVAGGENHPAHGDAVKVAQAKAKLQKSGTSALSNKELQELQNRLNLERNVKQLVGSTTTTGRGRKFVRGLTGFNKEINEAVGTGLQTERLARQVKSR